MWINTLSSSVIWNIGGANVKKKRSICSERTAGKYNSSKLGLSPHFVIYKMEMFDNYGKGGGGAFGFDWFCQMCVFTSTEEYPRKYVRRHLKIRLRNRNYTNIENRNDFRALPLSWSLEKIFAAGERPVTRGDFFSFFFFSVEYLKCQEFWLQK